MIKRNEARGVGDGKIGFDVDRWMRISMSAPAFK